MTIGAKVILLKLYMTLSSQTLGSFILPPDINNIPNMISPTAIPTILKFALPKIKSLDGDEGADALLLVGCSGFCTSTFFFSFLDLLTLQCIMSVY